MEHSKLTRTSSGYRAGKAFTSAELKSEPSVMATLQPSSPSGITRYLIYSVYIATLGPLLFGFHLAELNAPQKVITCEAEELPGFLTEGLAECIPMDAFQWGLVQSMFTIGGFLGAIFSGFLATRFGRLFALKWAAFFLSVGPVSEALAEQVRWLAFGRGVSGLGAGFATVVAPLYISEVAPSGRRGFFGVFTQVQINAGIVIAQLLGYFLSQNDEWRWILASGGCIAGALFFGLMLTPETPRWLAAHNRPRLAKGVLQQLRGNDADSRQEMESWDILEEGEEERLLGPPSGARAHHIEHISVVDVIRNPHYRRAVFAVTGTMMAQQLTGINSVVMYSVAILGKIMPEQAGLVTVIVSSINVLVTLLAAPLPDRIGRKPCLLASIGGMGSASGILYAGLNQQIDWLTISALGLFVASFGVGLGPVPFILTSEFVGNEAAGAVSSWALAGNWLSTFLVAMFFPVLNKAIGDKVWWIFSGMAVFWLAFVQFFVPESKGKANPQEVWNGNQEP